MRFEDEFLQGEILSGKRKKEFLEDAYPQDWLSEDYKKRNDNRQ